MSRGFHPFCERRVNLLLAALLSAGFHILQPDLNPVPGAWVGYGSEWIGAADRNGFFSYDGTLPDTIRIHATGFTDWTGPVPDPGGRVILSPRVINSGAVINVLASRGSLSPAIPSTAVLLQDDLEELGVHGMERLNGKVPGVTVREYGGSMPVVSVSLRGGDPSQSGYLVDGVSIISARDGMPTGTFDPSIFSSLEIARGGLGGGTGSSGGLNFLPPSSNTPLSLRMSVLSNGGFRVVSRFRRTGASFSRSIGNLETQGFSSSLVTTWSSGSLGGGFLGSWADGETESPDWTIQSDGRRQQSQGEGWLNWSGESFEGDISGGAGHMEFNQTAPSSVDDTHKDFTGRISMAWKGPFTIRGEFNTASSTSTATGDHSINSGTIGINGSTGIISAAADYRISDEEAEFSGRMTLHRAFLEQTLKLHLSFYTDHRSPTVNDLYWPWDGQTQGNPDLKSERSTGTEVGISWQGYPFTAGICGFAAATDDMILWLPDDSGIWTPSNISSALSRGIETTGGFSSASFTTSGTFTWNIAEDRTQGTPREGMLIPYRPEYTWGICSRLQIPWGTSLELNVQGTGKRFTNRTQTEYLDEFWLADISASRSLSESLSVEITAGNVTDRDYYVTNGYSGRGRTLGLSLQYQGE